MHLSIYTPKKTLFEGDVRSVNCATRAGEITVLDRHEPLITVLKACEIKIVDANGETRYIPVSSGFLESRADNNKKTLVRVLADEDEQNE